METKYFPLGTSESNKLIKSIRIVFGIVCIVVAVFWTIYNINIIRTSGNLWITISFLLAFGFYQIWSGLGRADRFIEISPDKIRLKRNPFNSPIEMFTSDIDKIEVFPMNIVFFLKPKKRIMLRFGATFHDINGKIMDEIVVFAESHKIPLEIIEEKI
jgi:hypothetical protein